MEFPVSLVFFVQLFFFSVELPLTLSEPVGLVTVTELVSFVLTWSWTVSITFFIIRPIYRKHEPVEAPEGTMARCRPVSVTMSTSTVGLPRESYTERA